MMDDDILGLRWAHRQELLRSRLEALGGAGLDFRADLVLGRFWWQHADGRPVVVAATRFLLSYARSNNSILCGWANHRMPAEATVPAVDGVPDRVEDATEADAWALAMRVAEAVGAHFIYRAPTPQAFSFLGLWDVRAAAEGDAPFVAGSPWPYVRQVLDALRARLDEGGGIDALARGYGRTFAEDHMRRGTSLEAPLRSIGERLEAAAGVPRAKQSDVLATLGAEVRRYEAD